MQPMPEKSSLTKGTRVTVRVMDVEAHGTVQIAMTATCAGGASVCVELDGTNQRVWVPWANLTDEVTS